MYDTKIDTKSKAATEPLPATATPIPNRPVGKRSLNKEGKTCMNKESIAKFDSFGTSVGFNFSEESSVYSSVCGSILTCIVMMLTLVFTLQGIIVLEGRRDTLFTTTQELEANADRIFTAEDGLQFAIGIIDYAADDFEDGLGRNFNDYLILNVH